jgi:hypothetical protein
MWRAAAHKELHARIAAGKDIIAEIRAALADCLKTIEDDLAAHGEASVAKFTEFSEGVIAQLAIDGQANHDEFVAATDALHLAVEEFLDHLTKKWNYWLQTSILPHYGGYGYGHGYNAYGVY